MSPLLRRLSPLLRRFSRFSTFPSKKTLTNSNHSGSAGDMDETVEQYIARGGDFTKEKSRLYLSMDYNNARACTRVTIVDAKAPKFKDGVKDWYRDVKIINGSRFFPMDNWRRNDGSDPKASL